MIIVDDNKRKLRERDWVCTDPLCGNVNYSWRKICNKCRKSRDEFVPPLIKVIGKNAAEKSEGIFKSEDWQCKQCGNVNWARRQCCNRCKTSKFDPINMISPEELMDENDDNLSVHSSLSSLNSPPADTDSGIGSCEDFSSEKKKSRILEKNIVDLEKICNNFSNICEKEFLEGNSITDKEMTKNVFLIALCALYLNKDSLPKSEELANLNPEERLMLLASRSDLPDEWKSLFSKTTLSEIKQAVSLGLATYCSKPLTNEFITENIHPTISSSIPSTEKTAVPLSEAIQPKQKEIGATVTRCECVKSSASCNPIHCDGSHILSKTCACDRPQMPAKQHECAVAHSPCNQHSCGAPRISSVPHTCCVSHLPSSQHVCERPQASSKQHNCDGSCIPKNQHEGDRPQAVKLNEQRRVVIVTNHRSTRSRSHSPQEERTIIFRPRRSQSPRRRNYVPVSRPQHYRSNSRHHETRERTRDYRHFPYRRYSRTPSRR